MKKLLLIFPLLLLFSCQSGSTETAKTFDMQEKKITVFNSDDNDVNKAVEKVKQHFKTEGIPTDSFYVSSVQKDADTISLILLHYDLLKKIEENKKQADDEWSVLPPLSAMPEMAKKVIYSIKKDRIIKDPSK